MYTSMSAFPGEDTRFEVKPPTTDRSTYVLDVDDGLQFLTLQFRDVADLRRLADAITAVLGQDDATTPGPEDVAAWRAAA